ncbi:MAG: UDP-galactopyranose mutase, partial [Chitinophagaceae bacterium]|nr:UDP-galactopyranose mutase [Chitinophagaceae bacterium]
NELKKRGKRVCVIDSRNHIGGNCYTEKRDGIQVHIYGPHIFHTSNERIWKWINQLVSFNNFTLRPVANYKGSIYSLPFNMWTFSKLWDISLPEEAKAIIESQGSAVPNEPQNLEEQAIKLVGTDIYHKLIKGYTQKQWGKEPASLPASIIKRLPVRFTYDNNYFNDKYQGIPIGGYTQIFEKLLEGIEVRLNTDFFTDTLPGYDNLIYTGPIDRYYGYKYGELEYKTTQFDHRLIKSTSNYQGVAMMNFTDIEVPYTRIIEHKHFENTPSDHTWISYEYPSQYQAMKTEPFYPVNDTYNNEMYAKYKSLAEKENKVFFGGRLAEYKYYDMHQVIESALDFISNHKL